MTNRKGVRRARIGASAEDGVMTSAKRSMPWPRVRHYQRKTAEWMRLLRLRNLNS
jgi:hypothetical protein